MYLLISLRKYNVKATPIAPTELVRQRRLAANAS
jgi:hypothetical protein